MFSKYRLAAAVVAALVTASSARAEVTVTVSDMHLCCKGCTMAAEDAATKIAGVTCVANKDEASAKITAADYATVQKAIDEIAKAGLAGTPDSKEVKFTPAKTPEGKVTKLEITHIHNCCGACTDAIAAAVEGVEGVTTTTLKPKATSFVVEGDFVAADVIKALTEAGFYGSTDKVEEAKQ